MKTAIKLLLAGSLFLNVYFLLKNTAGRTGEEDESVERAFEVGTPKKQVASGGNLLNINDASASELTILNGIGEDLANKIVDDRQNNGRFSKVDDLTRVNGLGEKKLDMFRDSITT